jgi:choline dehydrogenase-like flavoprotein
MPDIERYKNLVIGSGEAGKFLAWTMAKAGHQIAMIGRMPYTTLRDAIFAHPTMSEGLVGLLASIPAKSTQRSA